MTHGVVIGRGVPMPHSAVVAAKQGHLSVTSAGIPMPHTAVVTEPGIVARHGAVVGFGVPQQHYAQVGTAQPLPPPPFVNPNSTWACFFDPDDSPPEVVPP